jgi:secreted PhoX family phosphatase
MAAVFFDFGDFRENQLNAHSEQLYGINDPVAASSTLSIDAVAADSDPTRLVTLAKGLSAHVVSSLPNLGPNIDQMALWPAGPNPTHIIACNEEGTAQPGLQRVRLSDGLVETIVTGTTSCDPVRRTAWGTIVFGEEAGASGWMIELINPLATTGVTFDRIAGTFSGGVGTANLATLPALGRLSFEGLAVYPNGVVYYGDENRPGGGNPGGAYFKFIPSTPRVGGGAIGNLTQSPLVAGTVFGLRIGNRNPVDNGQGNNIGRGAWVNVNAGKANLRAAASAAKLSAYYRPEDIDIDSVALANGDVRFCGNNTGDEALDHNWGETICITDGSLVSATANTAVPELQYLVLGNSDFAMMDNIAYQPGRGNWIIHEDGDAPEFAVNPHNNDLWSCLDDGSDADGLSDGCVRIGTLNDLHAEWTGGFFDQTGTHFYVSVQHNVTGHGVILDITGWR